MDSRRQKPCSLRSISRFPSRMLGGNWGLVTTPSRSDRASGSDRCFVSLEEGDTRESLAWRRLSRMRRPMPSPELGRVPISRKQAAGRAERVATAASIVPI